MFERWRHCSLLPGAVQDFFEPQVLLLIQPKSLILWSALPGWSWRRMERGGSGSCRSRGWPSRRKPSPSGWTACLPITGWGTKLGRILSVRRGTTAFPWGLNPFLFTYIYVFLIISWQCDGHLSFDACGLTDSSYFRLLMSCRSSFFGLLLEVEKSWKLSQTISHN